MRIADSMQYDQVKSAIGKNRSEMAHLQNEAATQKRVTKPSDDPLAATRVLADRTEIQSDEQFSKNTQTAKSQLDFAAQTLQGLVNAIVRAKQLALAQANDAGTNATSRQVAAAEVGQLLNQAIQIANSRLGDRFVFGGYKITQPPVDNEGQYHGDNGVIQIQINKESKVPINIPGSEIFYGKDLSAENASDTTEQNQKSVPLRGPASVDGSASPGSPNLTANKGVNIFHVLRNLEIGLQTNDKQTIQDSLDLLDKSLHQVIYARSEMGARINLLQANLNSLQRASLDSKVNKSQMEDADTFALVSDISKTQNALQATLETSGKLIQPSLLDFIK